MATVTAPAAPPARSVAPPRHYWQLPVFAIGVAAAVAAVVQFPPPPSDPSRLAGQDIAALRAELEKRPADLVAITDLTRKVAAAVEQSPADANVARFLAGTGFVALAEYGPPTEAQENWAAAAKLFAAVDRGALPDPADPHRYEYRQAKVAAATGAGDLNAVYTVLSKGPIGIKDEDAGAGERFRLLAEVCLKLGSAKRADAKAALTTYLGSPSRLPPAALAKLKLTLGQIHADLNETDKARTWFKEASSSASPDVQAEANVQLARLAVAESDWNEAVKRYEIAQSAPGLPDAERGAIWYQIGVAHVRLKNPAAAGPYFERTLKIPAPVATAAAVRLAEITVRSRGAGDRCGKAVDLLEAAVSQTGPAATFTNSFVTAPELQAAFEETIQVCLNEPDFPAAARAVAAYAKVAAPGRDMELRAEVNVAWATALQQDPKAASDVAAKLKSAASDYTALANTYPTSAGKAVLWRKAADCQKKSGDRTAAVATLDRIIQAADIPPDITTGAWLDRGEMLLLDGKPADAEQAFRTAMAGSGLPATTARTKLGMIHVDRSRARTGGTDAASEAKKQLYLGQSLLAQVANKTVESAAEREVQQQALHELGKLLLEQQNYADAEARFRQLILLNPTGPLVESARLWLGSCLLLIVRGDHQGGRPPADADRKLTEARELFLALADSNDPFLRTQADVRLAITTLLVKRYDDMPALCEKLAQKYRGKVEELFVLSLLYSSQGFTDRPADAARTLSRMEDAYSKLQDADFLGGREEYTREWWRRWFQVVKSSAAVQ